MVKIAKALGVMQPYIFPYLGYFQHIHAVDVFILYDDVTYILGGWINRNILLLQGKRWRFTIPLTGASPNKEIRHIPVSPDPRWKRKLLATIRQAYSKAPFFESVYPIIEETFAFSGTPAISELVYRSLMLIIGFLGIETHVVPTSSIYENKMLGRSRRLIDLCHREGANRFINPIGGAHLYSTEEFSKEGIELLFLKMRPIRYQQFRGHSFIENLSIVDVLMFNGADGTRELLDEYDLL